MKEYSTNNSPEWIFNDIANQYDSDEYRYVILGKNGPTGKSWLCSKLKKDGFDAVELSEQLMDNVYYSGHQNYVKVDELHKTVIIILNKPLEIKKKTKVVKLIVEDEVTQLNIETAVKDGNGYIAKHTKHALFDIEDDDVFDLIL